MPDKRAFNEHLTNHSDEYNHVQSRHPMKSKHTPIGHVTPSTEDQILTVLIRLLAIHIKVTNQNRGFIPRG